MKITHAESIALNIPFYAEHVTRAMHRASTHDERVWVVRLETDKDLVGWADSHGQPSVDDLVGQNPASLINRDDIGFGPQVACLDLVGQDNGVPVHELLGVKLRDRCPISWWDIDMPPQDWVAEAEESLRRGYTCFKMKARPWRDIIAQTEAVAAVVPADYKFDVDFNGFLLNQAKAEIILQKLDENPNVGMYESPFYLHSDVDGARILRERVRKPIVEHYQDQYLRNNCCDGFVIGSGATETRRTATLAAAHNKPFWLQLVGAGLTTAYAAHLGAVLSHAQLPYITCHELWEDDLLQEPIEVRDGYMPVLDAPGLGVSVDEDAIATYRVDPAEPTPKHRYLAQKRILRVSWPSGSQAREWEFTAEDRYQRAFYAGNIPGFEQGVDLQVIEDDNSAAFQKRHAELLAQGR